MFKRLFGWLASDRSAQHRAEWTAFYYDAKRRGDTFGMMVAKREIHGL